MPENAKAKAIRTALIAKLAERGCDGQLLEHLASADFLSLCEVIAHEDD
jgi:hypothetical protein